MDDPTRIRATQAFLRFQATGNPGDLAQVFDATAGELLRVAVHLVADPHAADQS